jgi:hypothetical protein
MSPRDNTDDSDLSPRDRFLKSQKERNETKKKKSKKGEIPTDEKGNTRNWDFKAGVLTKSDMEKLDRSKNRSSEISSKSSNIYLEEDEKKALDQFIDSDKEVEESTFFKKMIGNVQKVIGNKSLTQ